MAFGDLFLKIFARRVLAERNAGAAGHAVPVESASVFFANPFQNFWSLDERKTKWQAMVTVFFFLIIVKAMDAVIFIPFAGKEQASEILGYVHKFPPSLFVGVALTVLAMTGRAMPRGQKIALAVFAIGGGVAVNSLVAVLPLTYILQAPLKGEAATETIQPSAEEIAQPALQPDKPDGWADPLADFLNKN